MSHPSRAIFLILTIVAVLFVSAVGTTNVYADDGTPPPPPTETGEVDPSTGEAEPVATEPAVVTPPAEEAEPVATEAAVTEPIEESVPSEEAPVVEEAPVAEAAPIVEEQQPAEAEAAPILEQVPDNTTVTVLNAEGEAQALTSQESADAILTSDPIWCPQFVTPAPGANGCTQAYASFTELLTFLKANEGNATYQQAGTIYVQMGVYTGPESSIDFNSYSFTNLNQYDLTLQGGWDPADNSTDPADVSTLEVPVLIGASANPWVGSLTLNNIYITNVNNQTGLTLFSQDSVTLSNVQVTNSLGGADLNAGGDVIVQNSKFNKNKKFGAKINAGGFVYITDSEFNNNAYSKDQYDGYGLEIDSQGDVFLGTVSASLNEKFGADINSAASVAVWNSVFNGNISYTHDCKEKPNGGYGLKIVSTSTVDLEAVNANDNYLFGAHLEGTDVSVIGGTVDGVFKTSTFNGNGSDILKDPKGYGLEVVATGGVTLSDLEANNNQLFGANVQATGKVVISNSFFDGNKSYYESCKDKSAQRCKECTKTYYGYGLQVVTTGDIELNTVSASNNYLFGAHLEGANVGIGTGTFSGNGSGSSSKLTGEGLQIESTANVNLSNVAANNNQLFGGDILAAGDVNITLSTFNGQKVFSGTKLVDGGYGLQVVATGETSAINLTAVTASDNYLYGMHLSGYSVQIAGLGSAYSQAEDNKEGVKIEATGAVSIDMLQANDNKLFGATIQSGTNEAFDGTVLITNSFFNGNASYTSSSCKGKTFYGYGLKVITTADDILLTNVEANDNYLYGAHLEGANIDVSQSVFNSNGTDNKGDHVGKGLEIVSTGSSKTVSLTDVTASNNQLFGANIQAEGFVFVNTSVFNGNQSYTVNKCGCKTYDGYGIKIVTTGSAYLYGVEAQQNYLFGGHVEGSYVSVSNSVFSNNVSPTHKGKTPTGRGLEVVSTGDVSLTDVDASNNQLFGATIEAGGAVSVISSTFMNNKYYTYTSCKGKKSAGYGLKVVTTDPAKASPIVLSGVEASNNGAEGAILVGESGSTVNVTNSTFKDNGATGLSITASDNVTLTNVTASGNKGHGVYVKGACTNTVFVNGGTFTDNSKYGIKVVNATYTPDGTQTFGGNGYGNVFQSDCVTTNASNTSSNQNK